MRRDPRNERDERGAALPTVAILLVALLAMAALAVDLGWLFLTSARVQRAADAAALAGVANLPLSASQADVDAATAASVNGFGSAAMDTEVLPENRYRVTLSTEIPTFFASVVGIDSLPVTRTATAQNLPPLALGNRDSQFGNLCKPNAANPCGGDNFWANIHGRYTDTVMGDARSSYCDVKQGSGSSSCAQNPNYRSTGYLYGIERGANPGFTVSFIDMAFHNDVGPPPNTGDDYRTGDRGCEPQPKGGFGGGGANCGPRVTARLYAPDPTPLDLSDNGAPLCSYTWNPQPKDAEEAAYVAESPAGCFHVGAASDGIYVLQIVNENPAKPTDSGLNRYSVGVTANSKIFGLGDFSIYNNVEGTTNFDLAEVPSYYAGKTLVIELYDPGDSTNEETGELEVIPPAGTSVTCRMYVRSNSPSSNWTQKSSSCEESVSKEEYNGEWVKFEVDLPTDYSCTVCWFEMQYRYTKGVRDTTTWTAYMIGDPLRLVPNP